MSQIHSYGMGGEGIHHPSLAVLRQHNVLKVCLGSGNLSASSGIRAQLLFPIHVSLTRFTLSL